jgi:hypothetical protein
MKKAWAHITPGYTHKGRGMQKGYAPLNAIHWQGCGPVLMLAKAARARR